MWVKKPQEKRSLASLLARLRDPRVVFFLLFPGFLAFMFLFGAYCDDEEILSRVGEALRSGGRVPVNWVLSLGTDVPELRVDGPEGGSATLVLGQEKAEATLRTGDGSVGSFEALVEGDATLLGAKRLSLRRPGDDGGLGEWFWQRLLTWSGLPGGRFELVDLEWNGEDLGLHALTGHEVFDVELFDVDQLATFCAVLDLVGQSADLDPEPRDVDAVLQPAQGLVGAGRPLFLDGPPTGDGWNRVFGDPVFFEAYVRALERTSQPEYLAAFFQEHGEELSRWVKVLHKSSPGYSFAPTAGLVERNRRYVRDFLTPATAVQAYFRGFSPDSRRLELEVASLHALPRAVVGVSLAGGVEVAASAPTVLQPHAADEPLVYVPVAFELPPEVAWDDVTAAAIVLRHKVVGASEVAEDGVHPWAHREASFLAHDFMRQAPNFEGFDFLRSEGESIVFTPGQWRLERSLILPAGRTVVAGPGVELDLVEGALVLSYSPLDFHGTAEEPIVVGSSDGLGQGLVVLQAGRRSTLEHVRFLNLTNPKQSGWSLTSTVTFFESDVTLRHAAFVVNTAEDGFNVVRGEFSVEDTLFERTFSDAFDVDFGRGRVVRTTFRDCGNDGLDVSGTDVEIEDVVVDGSGDKGLSAGEDSRMTGRRVAIRRSEIAVASKDLSEVVIDGLEIEDCRVGFTVFRKKPEFGEGRITVTGVTLEGVEVDYLVERGSFVSLNGRQIPPTHDKVEELLYGAQFGKASRR